MSVIYYDKELSKSITKMYIINFSNEQYKNNIYFIYCIAYKMHYMHIRILDTEHEKSVNITINYENLLECHQQVLFFRKFHIKNCHDGQ